MFKIQDREDEALVDSINALREAIEAREDCDPRFAGDFEQMVLEEELARENYLHHCELTGLDPELMYDEVVYGKC